MVRQISSRTIRPSYRMEGVSFSKKLIYKISDFTSSAGLKVGAEKSGLITLVFHAVSVSNKETEDLGLLPTSVLRLFEYRQIFDYFLEVGYVFVSAKMISSGLPIGGKYVHVTFDDGYFNNTELLPLISEYKIPIHIFIATTNVLSNKKYWWDIVYEQLTKSGKNMSEISSLLETLKKQPHREIDHYLKELFGDKVFTPDSDANRPLMPNELKDLSDYSLVTIGNHTRDHVIMERVGKEEMLDQIAGAQKDLGSIIGYEPTSFAFPNGNYCDDSLDILSRLKFDLGFSCDQRLNNLERDFVGKKRLCLGRYLFISSLNLVKQCQMFRVAHLSPIFIAKRIQKLVGR